MNAVIYARFSSDRQREESIEGQVRECTEYAEKNGLTIVETYIDRALSASKGTEKRLDFQRMIRDSSKRLFDVVLVWKLDRFARNRYDSAHYKNILKKNGIRVMFVIEHITEGPEGIILESMLEGMAEYYSAELSEKIHRGQKENALKGKNNGGGIPLGYVLGDDQRLKLDPLTAPIVREIFERYAGGETAWGIIRDLNSRGITTRRGKQFLPNSFSVLLKNRKYIGEYRYQDVVIPDGVPAIVPNDIFEAVQARIEKNRRAPARAKARDDYLLTTKLFCGHCGGMMVGESGTSHTGDKHFYYKCVNAKRKKTCNKRTIKKAWIENIVVRYTMLMLQNDRMISRLVDDLMEIQGEEGRDLKLLRQKKLAVEMGITNMLNAIQAGIITPSTKERLTELEEQKSQIEKNILREQIKHPVLSREQITYFMEKYRQMDMQDPEQRKRLIDCFVNAVYVYDDKIILTFNYKDGTKTITLDDVKGSDLDSLCPPQGYYTNTYYFYGGFAVTVWF